MDETTGARNTPGSPSPTDDTTPTPSLADDTAPEQPTDQLPAAEPVAEQPAAAEAVAEQSVAAAEPAAEQAVAEQFAEQPVAAQSPAYATPPPFTPPAFTPPPDTGTHAEGTEATGTARPPIRLRRSRDERMIAGVCGGLAQVLGVDVVILRLALVLATVLGLGAGVILYLACWILMPVAPENESTPAHAAEQAPAPTYPTF
jgi:phage shock protein PspC (stress-responsive transcriptional regulator)